MWGSGLGLVERALRVGDERVATLLRLASSSAAPGCVSR